MTPLNKLIQQYAHQECENIEASESLVNYLKYQFENSDIHFKTFIQDFLASRPTCGKEQRKFLDEVEMCVIDEYDWSFWKEGEKYISFPSENPYEFNLQKVIKGM